VEDEASDRPSPRWEYRLVWRYGPLLLIILGMALFAIGLSGLCATAVSTAALPVGLVLVLSGAVLPRVEGKFSAGPHGISATILGSRAEYVVFGPPVTSAPAGVTGVGAIQIPTPAVSGEGHVHSTDGGDGGEIGGQLPAPVALGDVREAVQARTGVPGGFRILGTGSGGTWFEAPDGRTFVLPSSNYYDYRPASADLLDLLASWQVEPVVSGKYRPLTTYRGLRSPRPPAGS
jgi:hypothetical protein